MSTERLLAFIAVASVCTFATRVIPFAVFGNKEVPKIVKFLGDFLPTAIIGVLIIYCIRDGITNDFKALVPQLIAIAITVVVHLIKRNTLLSIALGTISYMLLIHFVF